MYTFIEKILKCPITSSELRFVESWPNFHKEEHMEGYFVNESNTFLYPIQQGIILLLPKYGIPLTERESDAMVFDKKRVFDYYNTISYIEFNDKQIYADSNKWVDYRSVSYDYFKNSFARANDYLPATGKYYLDIASGPIGIEEYMQHSRNFEYRICIDISFPALVQAKKNLKQKGIFICGDITNIPLKDNTCDAVVSHHTLYHIPKNEQAKAVQELYRVTNNGGVTLIVYNWFLYSLLMNVFLFPIQVYRLIRHVFGKIYVNFVDQSKPRLYFYVYPPSWFRKFSFADKISIYSWRTANQYFVRTYIHEKLGGKKILKFIQKLETKYPKTMGLLGDYPIIVIHK